MPKDTPGVSDPDEQSVQLEPLVEDLTGELPTETVPPADTGRSTEAVPPSETGLRVDIDADLDAEIDDLFN